MSHTLTYLKNFVQDRYVASVTPTSRRVIRQLCDRIDFEQASLLVEYGPGTGVISRELLARMRPDAELLLIERNPNFVTILRNEFADPRVTVYHEDARNVKQVLEEHGSGPADYLVSGIPFSWLQSSTRDAIIHASYEVLRQGGRFIAYQMFWQADEHLLDFLNRYFPQVRSEFALGSIPPLRVYDAAKNGVVGSNGSPGQQH